MRVVTVRVNHSNPTLSTNFAPNYNVFYVWIYLRLMAGQYAGCCNDDVNSLHELDPFLFCVAPYAKGASIVQRAQNLPGAKVERDIEQLGDSHTRGHSCIARGSAYYCAQSKY